MKKRTYTIDGIRYESMNVVAKDLGVSPVTVRNRLQSPNYPGYVSKRHPKRKPWRASDLGSGFIKLQPELDDCHESTSG